MGYTPNNDCVYLKAAAGCLAALGAPGRYADASAGDESAYARIADAYAQEFDIIWGLTAPTGFEEDGIFAASLTIWRGRSPLESSLAFIPRAYAGIVAGAIALVLEGNAQIIAEGIDPNSCAGSGGGGTFGPPIVVMGGAHIVQPGELWFYIHAGDVITMNPAPTVGVTLEFTTVSGTFESTPCEWIGNGHNLMDPQDPEGFQFPHAPTVTGRTSNVTYRFRFDGSIWACVN